MSVGGKLFWGAFAVELAVAVYIGWQIANATHHPWEIKPQAKKPNPLPQNDDGHRGARQRSGQAISLLNLATGEFVTSEDVS